MGTMAIEYIGYIIINIKNKKVKIMSNKNNNVKTFETKAVETKAIANKKVNINDFIDTTRKSKSANANCVHFAKYGTSSITEFLSNFSFGGNFYYVKDFILKNVLSLCKNVKNYTLVNNYILCTTEKYLRIKSDKEQYIRSTEYWLVDIAKGIASEKVARYSAVDTATHKTLEDGKKFIDLYNKDFAEELARIDYYRSKLKDSNVNNLLEISTKKVK